jgi:hypothetical protein
MSKRIFLFEEKDVMRTDRSHSFFEGEKNPNLQTMTDILMTYNMYNFDLGKSSVFKSYPIANAVHKRTNLKGYVQGMSDLLAPLMVVFDNEVDSFWSFVGFMNKLV